MNRSFLIAISMGWLAATAVTAATPTVFTGVRLIDGAGNAPVENATLVVEGDRIAAVGAIDAGAYAKRPDVQVIDLHGNTIIPGLISDHSHVGLIQNGKFAPDHYTRENVEHALKTYEGYGITAILSLGMNQDLLYDLRAEQHEGRFGGADIFTADRGIGVPDGAPPVPAPTDQLARVSTPDEARQAVRAMAARHADIIKLWDDNFFGSVHKMPPEIFSAIIDEAHKNNLRVASHLFYLDDAKSLARSGVDVIAHSVRDQPVDDELIALLKERKVAYIPTLQLDESQFVFADHPDWMQSAAFRTAAGPKLLAEWKSPEYAKRMKANLFTPRNRAALEMGLSNVKKLFDAGVLIGFGTDSGATATRIPGWAEHRELQLLVKAGLTPMQAIVCATHNASDVLGQSEDRGTLEAGKRADFVILSRNPLDDISNTTAIVAIYHGGRRIEPAFGGKN